MAKSFSDMKKRLLLAHMSLEERTFNLLCIVGFFTMLSVSLIRGLWMSSNNLTLVYMLIITAMLGLSFLAANRLGVRGAIPPLLAVMLNLLFPLTAFSSGGIHSGMTAYFVLGLSLVFILLRGKICTIMVCSHVATALVCYILSYLRPDLVSPLNATHMVYLDSVMGILVSGLVLYMLIRMQTNAYIDAKISAQTAFKARSDFLANMSHEIRTPLNAIIGISEMELRNTNDPEIKERFKKMHASGVTLLNLINDILDISKMEAGHFEVRPEEYEFASMVLDVINMNIGLAGDRPIEFKVRVSENVPRALLGDEISIKQILNNVLSNAFKYTDKGRVELRIHARKDAVYDDLVWLRIHVLDTGSGIKEEDIGKIFSEYGKLDRQATAVVGIGIGLAICKKLTEMMGGSIETRSKFGQGSLFTVVIPQKIIDPRPIGEDTTARLNAAPALISGKKDHGGKLRFSGMALVVDDVDINRDIAMHILEGYGLDTHGASSGQQAVKLIAQGEPRYDIIFMDHMMPGMNGCEAVRKIRSLGSEYALRVPIIGLTAGDRGDCTNDFLTDVQDFMSKPIDVSRLEKVLVKWLA